MTSVVVLSMPQAMPFCGTRIHGPRAAEAGPPPVRPDQAHTAVGRPAYVPSSSPPSPSLLSHLPVGVVFVVVVVLVFFRPLVTVALVVSPPPPRRRRHLCRLVVLSCRPVIFVVLSSCRLAVLPSLSSSSRAVGHRRALVMWPPPPLPPHFGWLSGWLLYHPLCITHKHVHTRRTHTHRHKHARPPARTHALQEGKHNHKHTNAHTCTHTHTHQSLQKRTSCTTC